MAQFDGKLNETGTGKALVALLPRAPRPRPGMPSGAAFLSQLIAEHHHLAPQRRTSRVPVGTAVGAYVTGSRIAVVRMPIGYRTTVVA